MNQTWDAGGEASAALLHVVEGFGTPVLGRPDMLEGLLADDVPQLPREIAMLTEAARQGVADLIAQRVSHGVAPQAAVAMVANDLTSRTAVDAAGALWAASVFARAAGLPVGGPPVAGVVDDNGVTVPPPGAGPPVSTPPVAGPTPAGPTRVISGGISPGLGGSPPGPTTADPTPPDQTIADGPQQTRRYEGGPEIYGPPTIADQQQTILPGQVGFPGPGYPVAGYPGPGYPGPGYPAPGHPGPGYPSPWAGQVATPGTAAAGNSQGLAVVASICFGVAALMQPFVGLGSHLSHAAYLLDWFVAIAELALFAAGAIWVGRSKGSAAGFAATVGLAVPAIPVGIYTALFLPNYGTPGAQHAILLLTTIVWLLACIVAAFVGIAGLAQQRQLTRALSTGPAIAAGIGGILFALANSGAQVTLPGTRYDSPDFRYGIFGTGVTGVHILWGLVLIALFAAPPLLAIFPLPGRDTRVALLCGWLLVTFTWQLGDTPIEGLVSAPSLYLTWVAWLATLLATAVLVTRPPAEAVDLLS
ncbi:MAG TPA: hypothetical protein VFI65_02550 [Streptosporangiaceae bacterium]|nr:hypothetical protein [Streptosporangiaceae bacterium]